MEADYGLEFLLQAPTQLENEEVEEYGMQEEEGHNGYGKNDDEEEEECYNNEEYAVTLWDGNQQQNKEIRTKGNRKKNNKKNKKSRSNSSNCNDKHHQSSTKISTAAAAVTFLPKNMKSYERFFASLLLSSPQEYYESVFSSASTNHNQNNSNGKNKKKQCFKNKINQDLELWTTICRRVGLRPPITSSSSISNEKDGIKAKYSNIKEHFAVRAAMVLEESRYTIAENIYKRWSKQQQQQKLQEQSQQQMKRSLTTKIPNQKQPKSSCNTIHVKCISIQQIDSYNHSNINIDNNDTMTGQWILKFRLVDITSKKNRKNKNKNKNKKNNQNQNQKKQSFTKEQLFDLRSGTVMEVLLNDKNHRSKDCNNNSSSNNNNNNNNPINDCTTLGCISYANREEIEKECTFSIMVFRQIPLLQSILMNKKNNNFNKIEYDYYQEAVGDNNNDSDKLLLLFQITPVAGLISELRQYEACTSKDTRKVPFVNALLGQWPKHTRFHYDDDDDDEDVDNNDNDRICRSHVVERFTEEISIIGTNAFSCSTNGSENWDSDDNEDDRNGSFEIPDLNSTQEKAATQFLNSSIGSITLIQGPPGTGKSQLLVSILCRYLLVAVPPDSPRLLVCAPTNKAVTVVATRFVQAIGYNKNSINYNVIMVGDVDKLLDSKEIDSNEVFVKQQLPRKNRPSSLRSIFVYTWMSEIINQYRYIRNQFVVTENQPFCKPSEILDNIHSLANRLHHKLLASLPISSKGCIANLSEIIWKELGERIKQTTSLYSSTALVCTIDNLIEILSALDDEGVCRELLNSANVIFCTLASAGARIFKGTPKVDDLIVDEASAATESELYIPFHLQPKRLMVIGDPQQLPATVLSRRAVALGFDKSLHERLMHDCCCPYIMLDIQYRMKPAISLFPSEKFYNGKIKNGENVTSVHYQAAVPLLCGKPYYFLQVDGKEEQAVCGSYQNYAEAHRVVELIQSLAMAHRDETKSHHQFHSDEKIRVITFYRAQVVLIQQLLNRRNLPQVLVATVDSSQGCEADLVIVSFVRSNNGHWRSHKGKSPSSQFAAGFLMDDRRLNVALTRAKYQLLCVGNAQAMSGMVATSTLHGMACNAIARQCILSFNDIREEREDDAAWNKRPNSCLPMQDRPITIKKRKIKEKGGKPE